MYVCVYIYIYMLVVGWNTSLYKADVHFNSHYTVDGNTRRCTYFLAEFSLMQINKLDGNPAIVCIKPCFLTNTVIHRSGLLQDSSVSEHGAVCERGGVM